jgi:hypothetical protein
MMSDPVTISGGLIMKIGIMSFIAGITGALNRYQTGEKLKTLDILIISMVHSFFGVLMGIIAKTSTSSEWIILGCAGTGGFLGITSLTIIKGWLNSIINIKL